MNFINKYISLKKESAAATWQKMKRSKHCYLFLAPYALLFTLFFIVPVIMSIILGFTYYNILEPPEFMGFQNYINLLLADDVFIIAVKNTLILAFITGPLGYIMAF